MQRFQLLDGASRPADWACRISRRRHRRCRGCDIAFEQRAPTVQAVAAASSNVNETSGRVLRIVSFFVGSCAARDAELPEPTLIWRFGEAGHTTAA